MVVATGAVVATGVGATDVAVTGTDVVVDNGILVELRVAVGIGCGTCGLI
jgi:ATP phosphoribosyltransferase